MWQQRKLQASSALEENHGFRRKTTALEVCLFMLSPFKMSDSTESGMATSTLKILPGTVLEWKSSASSLIIQVIVLGASEA